MSPQFELMLLQLILRKGDLSVFTRQGFTYSQIFKQIKEFENILMVSVDREAGKIDLTSKGEARIEELNKQYGREHSSAWISPLYGQMVDKIRVEDVYLPKKSKT